MITIITITTITIMFLVPIFSPPRVSDLGLCDVREEQDDQEHHDENRGHYAEPSSIHYSPFSRRWPARTFYTRHAGTETQKTKGRRPVKSTAR